MSKAYDKALEYLDRAFPLEPSIIVNCPRCGPTRVELDEAGSGNGYHPYLCGCGKRFASNGFPAGPAA